MRRRSTGTSYIGSVGVAVPTRRSRSCPSCGRKRPGLTPPAPKAFYFDPGWDLFEGSAIWDIDRLGPVEDFVTKLRHDYDLGLALHLMVHTKSLDEDPEIYRREADGSVALWVDDTPYVGGYVCPASPTWQRLKIERLRALALAGVSFFMFDFLSYERGGLEPFDHDRSAASELLVIGARP